MWLLTIEQTPDKELIGKQLLFPSVGDFQEYCAKHCVTQYSVKWINTASGEDYS